MEGAFQVSSYASADSRATFAAIDRKPAAGAVDGDRTLHVAIGLIITVARANSGAFISAFNISFGRAADHDRPAHVLVISGAYARGIFAADNVKGAAADIDTAFGRLAQISAFFTGADARTVFAPGGLDHRSAVDEDTEGALLVAAADTCAMLAALGSDGAVVYVSMRTGLAVAAADTRAVCTAGGVNSAGVDPDRGGSVGILSALAAANARGVVAARRNDGGAVDGDVAVCFVILPADTRGVFFAVRDDLPLAEDVQRSIFSIFIITAADTLLAREGHAGGNDQIDSAALPDIEIFLDRCVFFYHVVAACKPVRIDFEKPPRHKGISITCLFGRFELRSVPAVFGIVDRGIILWFTPYFQITVSQNIVVGNGPGIDRKAIDVSVISVIPGKGIL